MLDRGKAHSPQGERYPGLQGGLKGNGNGQREVSWALAPRELVEVLDRGKADSPWSWPVLAYGSLRCNRV